MYQLVSQVYKIAPGVLTEHGKTKVRIFWFLDSVFPALETILCNLVYPQHVPKEPPTLFTASTF
jgi:hypothetical protein